MSISLMSNHSILISPKANLFFFFKDSFYDFCPNETHKLFWW